MCPLQNSVLRGWAFERGLGHEAPLEDGIKARIKETTYSVEQLVSHHVRCRKAPTRFWCFDIGYPSLQNCGK
jgi:hypothetical protein